jgi:MFS family permease
LRALSPPVNGTARRDRPLVPVLGLCLLVGTAAYLMVFTMLGQIGAALHASGPLVNWMVTATIITGTVSAALFPAVGAVVGQRWLMTATLAFLAIGSLVSAAAPDAATLLVGRIIAAPGFAAGSLSIAVVREHRSGPDLPRAMGVIAAFAGAAAGVGFTLGGVVEEVASGDWRSVFLAVAAVSAATAVLAAVVIPGAPLAPRRPDVPGALLLGGGLVAALLPVSEGAAWGWTSWRVIALLAVAAALLTAWTATELRLADPLIRLRVLALPGVTGGIMLFLVTAATVTVINLTVPSFLQAPAAAGYGDAASVLVAGLDLLPFALAITAAGRLAGLLSSLVDPRVIAAATLSCEAVALGLLAAFHASSLQVMICLALFGVGHGGSLTAEYVLLTAAVAPEAAGAAAGLGSAVAGISGAVASAVVGALLAAGLMHVEGAALPAAADYSHAWLAGAALAAAGALTATAGWRVSRLRSDRPPEHG